MNLVPQLPLEGTKSQSQQWGCWLGNIHEDPFHSLLPLLDDLQGLLAWTTPKHTLEAPAPRTFTVPDSRSSALLEGRGSKGTASDGAVCQALAHTFTHPISSPQYPCEYVCTSFYRQGKEKLVKI